MSGPAKKHPNGNSKVKSKRNRDEPKKAQRVKDKLLIQYVANNKKRTMTKRYRIVDVDRTRGCRLPQPPFFVLISEPTAHNLRCSQFKN